MSEVVQALQAYGLGKTAAQAAHTLGQKLRARTLHHGTEFAAIADMATGVGVGQITQLSESRTLGRHD